MDDCIDDGDESVEETMREPVAKRMKRTRLGVPMMVEVEAEKMKDSLRGLTVDQDESDDDSTTHGELDTDALSADLRDARRMEMNSAKKVKERARRGKMADSVRSLRMLVPGCIDEKKVNQAQVLSNTVSYVTRIQEQVASLQRELEQLKMQVANGGGSFTEVVPTATKSSTATRMATTAMAGRGRTSANSRSAAFSSAPSPGAGPAPPGSSTNTLPTIKLITGANTARPPRPIRHSPIRISSTSPGASPTDSSPTSPNALSPVVPRSQSQSITSLTSMQYTDAMDSLVPFAPFFPLHSRPHSHTPLHPQHSSTTSTLSASPSTRGLGQSDFNSMFPASGESDQGNDFNGTFSSSLRGGFGGSGSIPSGSPTVFGLSFPAHYPPPSNTTKPEEGTYQNSHLMTLDDIEDVGSWPLYHTHETATANTGASELPYEWTMDESVAPHSMQQLPADHVHSFTLPANPFPPSGPPTGSSVCECGKRPIF